MQVNTNPLLKLLVFMLTIISLFVSFQFHEKNRKSVLWSDAEGYYLYLPAIFIYDGFEGIPPQSGQMTKFEGTEKIYTKYTCGVAILEAPFFLIGHSIAHVLNKDTSGYSSINNIAIRCAAIFYVMLGFYVMIKLLEKHFPTRTVLITIVCIFLGTNLFYYTVKEAGMSHAYSFFLFAVFLWVVPVFFKCPSLWNVALMSLVFGLITLIRPTNSILILYLIGFNIYSFKDIKNRFIFLLNQFRVLWIMPVIIFLVFIPQFYYWYYISGKFLIYSYNQEGFIYWNNPKILRVLFDVQNGWLLYSPIVIFGIVGLGIALYHKVHSAWVIFVIISIATYIFSSWWAWWFGGAFGHRCFIEFYTLLSFPFAYCLQVIHSHSKGKLKYLIYPALIFLVYYNIKLTYLYSPPWDGPNWTWERFGETLKELY